MATSKKAVTTSFLMMWWFPLVSISFVFLATLVVLIPQVKQIVELAQTHKKVKADLVSAETKISEIAAIDLPAMVQLSQLSNSALPNHKPYFEVLALMQRLSVETGAVLGEFSLTPGSLATAAAAENTSGEGYTTLKADVAIMGSTDQVTQFIERIQQAAPIVAVESIEIASEGTADLTQRQAKLTVIMYHSTQITTTQVASLDPLPAFEDEKKQVFVTIAGYVNPVTAESTPSVVDYSRTNLFSY